MNFNDFLNENDRDVEDNTVEGYIVFDTSLKAQHGIFIYSPESSSPNRMYAHHVKIVRNSNYFAAESGKKIKGILTFNGNGKPHELKILEV